MKVVNPKSLEVVDGQARILLTSAAADQRYQFEPGYFALDAKDAAPGKLSSIARSRQGHLGEVTVL